MATATGEAEWVSAALRSAAHAAYHQAGPIGPFCRGCARELLRINGVWHCTKCGTATEPVSPGCPYCTEDAHVAVVA